MTTPVRRVPLDRCTMTALRLALCAANCRCCSLRLGRGAFFSCFTTSPEEPARVLAADDSTMTRCADLRRPDAIYIDSVRWRHLILARDETFALDTGAKSGLDGAHGSLRQHRARGSAATRMRRCQERRGILQAEE